MGGAVVMRIGLLLGGKWDSMLGEGGDGVGYGDGEEVEEGGNEEAVRKGEEGRFTGGKMIEREDASERRCK
jgi:hypothetical protein